MKYARGMILAMTLAMTLSGCQTNQRKAASDSDYRREQADRQTQRDAQSPPKQVRRPLEQHQQERQDVIDQPR